MRSIISADRKSGLDFLKFVCAFLVICIHIPFPGTLGTYFSPLIRIAVPVFFMITGYFYTLTKSKNREKSQIVKIFKLCIGANGLYLVYQTALHIGNIGAFFKELFSLDVWIDFLVLNESPFSGHLWYLGALLYALIIVFLVEKKWDRKILYPLVPLLLLGDLALGKYSLLLFGASFPVNYVRNFLFVGLPCFLLGDMICRYKFQMKRLILLIGGVVFYLTTLLENYLLESFNMSGERENYISTTFLAVIFLLLFLQCNIDKGWFNKISDFGRKYSLTIYILHPMFIMVANKAIKIISGIIPWITPLYSYFAPVVILVASTFVAWLIELLKSKFNKNKTNG